MRRGGGGRTRRLRSGYGGNPSLTVGVRMRMQVPISNSPVRMRMTGETPGIARRKWYGGLEDGILAVRCILCEKFCARCARFLRVAAMPSVPVAYFIMFRCYGTWPQGDARGWVSRDGGNGPGTPLLPPFPRLAQDGARRQLHPGFWLSAAGHELCETFGSGVVHTVLQPVGLLAMLAWQRRWVCRTTRAEPVSGEVATRYSGIHHPIFPITPPSIRFWGQARRLFR